MKIEDFLQLANENDISELQVIEFQNNDLDLTILNDQQKNFILSSNTSYDIKAKINQKYVKASTNYLSEEVIDTLKSKSISIESDYEDFLIADSRKTKVAKAKKIKDIDINRFLNLYSLTKKHQHITSLEINYSFSNTAKRIVNTKGLDISTAKTIEIFDVQATAIINGKSYTNNDTIYNVKDDINYEEVVEKVINDIELNAKEKKLQTTKYNVILSEKFSSQILREFINLLSKEEIRKKTSCLEDKLNKQIFSPQLTIIEEPANKNYPAYNKFDNEGTPTFKKEIIKNGFLKTYLYNNKEALLDNKSSTGNAFGHGISAVNLYIKESKEKINLLEKLENGLYITKYQETGGTTLNKTTGDISVQIYGYVVENGKIISTFEPCILTTTIFELFSNIKVIGSTKKFKTSLTASPELLIENMSISSN